MAAVLLPATGGGGGLAQHDPLVLAMRAAAGLAAGVLQVIPSIIILRALCWRWSSRWAADCRTTLWLLMLWAVVGRIGLGFVLLSLTLGAMPGLHGEAVPQAVPATQGGTTTISFGASRRIR